MSKPAGSALTLFDHVRELQFRLLACVSVLLVGGVAGYFFYDRIFQMLRKPLHAALYYSSTAGSFDFVMKICLLVAIAVALPVIIYNLIMFIRPAFESKLSKTRVYLTTLGSVILAALGAGFGYIVILPASIKFFAGFQVKGLSALLDAMTYLSFVTNMLICFIVVFQIPLIIGFIDHIKPMSPRKLIKLEKWVIIGALIVGVVTPFSFDPTTQLLIAAPIVVLYNVTIVMILLQHAHKKHVANKLLKKEKKVAALEKKRTPVEPTPPKEVRAPGNYLPKPEYRKPSVLVNSFDVQRTSTSQKAHQSAVQPVHKPAPVKVMAQVAHNQSRVVQQKVWMDVAPKQAHPIPRPAPHMKPVSPRPEPVALKPLAPRTIYRRPTFSTDIF